MNLNFLHYLQGFRQFRKNNRQVYQHFAERGMKVAIKRYHAGTRSIRYLESGTEGKPLVIFVHGAPGSSDAFIDFLSDPVLASQAHMISVDRPGYGFSGHGRAVRSIQQQAALLSPLLSVHQHQQKPILVGHSYGGTIIARMAMDYPDQVGALVMAAPSLSPSLEKVFWLSYPAQWKGIRWALPATLRVINEEKLEHVAELRKMLPLWEKITVPATIIHGESDWLVPVGNATFGKKKMINALVKLVIDPEMNHLVPWERPDLMKEAILKYLA